MGQQKQNNVLSTITLFSYYRYALWSITIINTAKHVSISDGRLLYAVKSFSTLILTDGNTHPRNREVGRGRGTKGRRKEKEGGKGKREGGKKGEGKVGGWRVEDKGGGGREGWKGGMEGRESLRYRIALHLVYVA